MANLLKKKKMNLKNGVQLRDISTYRSELMGWAILWIMMLHFGFTCIKPLGFVAQYGYSGVEIFMFVSGFGLCFSLEKKPSMFEFYCRRLTRIFPAYYIVGTLMSFLIFHDTIFQYLFRYTTIGFWTGGLFGEWYVPSILFLYFLAPLLKKMGVKGQAGLAILLLAVSYALVEEDNIIDLEHFFLLYRIPAFLYGMICGRWCQQGADMKWYFLILALCIPAFIWLYPQFHQIYRYKYLSVLFVMPLFVYFFVLVSKYAKMFNPLVRKIGEASLEIYLIQSVYFVLIIRHMISKSDINTFILVVVSSVSGYFLHKALSRNRLFYLPSAFTLVILGVSVWYIVKWQPLLIPAQPQPAYSVCHHYDDTLRIAMYGDSWVAMHPEKLLGDTVLDRPILFQTCGRGGLKSGEVYNMMFSHRLPLLTGPDYCVIIAGINDANANVGTKYYCENYQQIIDHLLACKIRPVIIEIPDVDLKSAYAKPLKDILCDACRSLITASAMYDVTEYRRSLYQHLEERNMMHQVVYISKDHWNPTGCLEDTLYLKDKVHLNGEGYRKLDSCFVSEIGKDISFFPTKEKK